MAIGVSSLKDVAIVILEPMDYITAPKKKKANNQGSSGGGAASTHKEDNSLSN